MLDKIAACSEPKLLKQWIRNAQAKGNATIERAARLRLYVVLPSAEPGTLEHDVWTSIHALEDLEAAKRGKTIRLQRTRNTITDVGEAACVERLLLKSKPSSGYAMLLDYGLPDLLFESIALRHPSRFSAAALANARNRLDEAQRVGTGSSPVQS